MCDMDEAELAEYLLWREAERVRAPLRSEPVTRAKSLANLAPAAPSPETAEA